MRWDVFAWSALALLLFAAEALAPGAFMLWLGLAAACMLVGVLVVPDIPVLAQVAAFVVLGFAWVQVYRRWFRGRGRTSDQPGGAAGAGDRGGPWPGADRRRLLGRGRAGPAGRHPRAGGRRRCHDPAGGTGLRRAPGAPALG